MKKTICERFLNIMWCTEITGIGTVIMYIGWKIIKYGFSTFEEI